MDLQGEIAAIMAVSAHKKPSIVGIFKSRLQAVLAALGLVVVLVVVMADGKAGMLRLSGGVFHSTIHHY